MPRVDVSAGYRNTLSMLLPEVEVWLPLWREKKPVYVCKNPSPLGVLAGVDSLRTREKKTTYLFSKLGITVELVLQI